MKPEAQARQKIHQLLTNAGWQVKDEELGITYTTRGCIHKQLRCNDS